MKKKRVKSKLFGLLLACLFSLGVVIALPTVKGKAAPADPAARNFTRLIAASDFQANSQSDALSNMQAILSKMKTEGITDADGLLFGGDYDTSTYDVSEKAKSGIDYIKYAVKDVVAEEENMIFVQGNHDVGEDAGVGITPGGANDPESGDYGVFVLNEADYMWNNTDRIKIQQTAAELDEYLTEKVNARYNKPVFITSHIPLHFSMRTVRDGESKHSKDIFDVINRAGGQGLNIVFLFGHNHSNGWDNYIGGGSVFLNKGDKINIPAHSSSKFTSETLQFYYMNYGYVGRIDDGGTSGADTVQTMTVFEFDEEEMIISRYSKNGVHNLKSTGVAHVSQIKNESSYYQPNTKVYLAPQTVELDPYVGKVGAEYSLVRESNDLKMGESYLLCIENELMNSALLTEGGKVGLGMEKAELVENTIIGDYSNYAWILEQDGNKWKLKWGEQYLALSAVGTPSFSDVGTTFLLSPTSQGFILSANGLYLQKVGDRVYGTAEPSYFSAYAFSGYSLLTNADTGDGNAYRAVKAGTTVTLKAVPRQGKIFMGWVVADGEITLSSATEPIATFVMPQGYVKLKATYEAHTHILGDWNEQVDSTCEQEGTKGHYLCSACQNAVDENGYEIYELALLCIPHKGGLPTCTEQAVCTSCGEPYGEKDMTNHNGLGTWVEETPSTCTVAGVKGHYHCNDCGADLDENKNVLDTLALPLNEHQGGEATCMEKAV